MMISFWLPLWLIWGWKWSGALWGALLIATAVLALMKVASPRWFLISLVPFLAWVTFFVVHGLTRALPH